MKHKLAVLTGPVGSGKTVIFESLKKRHPQWAIVKSYTTRSPRPHEQDEKYIFVSREAFLQKVHSGDIIEHEEYAGHLYGTSKESITTLLQKESVVITHVNLRGAEFIKNNFANVVDIYLFVPLNMLKERVTQDKSRGIKDMKEYEERFRIAEEQNKQKNNFSYIVRNTSTIESATDKVEEIILTHP